MCINQKNYLKTIDYEKSMKKKWWFYKNDCSSSQRMLNILKKIKN